MLHEDELIVMLVVESLFEEEAAKESNHFLRRLFCSLWYDCYIVTLFLRHLEVKKRGHYNIEVAA